MRGTRHDPIAVPFDAATRQRIATIADLPVDVAVDYASLDRPTVLRRVGGWAEVEPAIREAVIADMTSYYSGQIAQLELYARAHVLSDRQLARLEVLRKQLAAVGRL